MADINVERKGPSVWPWVIGLIVLAILIWLLTEMFDNEEEVVTEPAYEEPAMVEPAPEPAAPSPMIAALPVAEILADPVSFSGRTVSGEVRVAEMAGEMALWVEDRGQRMLVVLDRQPPREVEPGRTIRITDARVVDAGQVEERVRQIAADEEVVLSASVSNVEIVEPGQQGPGGTDRAPR